MRKRIACAAALLVLPVRAAAQQGSTKSPPDDSTRSVSAGPDRVAALEDQVRTLAEQVTLLREEINSLRETKSAEQRSSGRLLLASSSAALPWRTIPSTAASGVADPVPTQMPQTSAGGVTPQVQQYGQLGGAYANAKLLNPDISFIGDFIGAVGHNTLQPPRALELHESEVGMQAIIDPYARADAFLSFGETGVNVEEGYITFTALPASLLLRAGKMRADFGKVNTIHNHALPFIDRPLVTNNLVGGEDGIDDAGLSLERIIPGPKNWFLNVTGQVFRGDSDDVFAASRRQDVSVVGHFRAYKDLSDSTNLDLGVSYARGHNPVEAANLIPGRPFLTNLYGADATLRWKPLRRAIYNSFLWRTELFWSARDQFSAPTGGFFQTQHAFGLYSSAEYRLNRRWTAGGRFDRSGHAENATLTDSGFSAILTYWPSEFSQIRGQYRFGHLAKAPGDFSNANELLFQFLFVMGAHGAHPF